MNHAARPSSLFPIFLCLSLAASAGARGAATEYFEQSAFADDAGPQTIVTFDDLSEGELLSSNAIPGLKISSRRTTVINPYALIPSPEMAVNVNSQPHGISASLSYNDLGWVAFDNLNDNFRISFDSPTFAAGLWVGNLGAHNADSVTPTTVTFLDTNGALIASEVLHQGHAGMIGSGGNNRVFYGLVSDIPIAGLTITNKASDADCILLDDIQFAEATPPGLLVLRIRPGVEVCWGTQANRQYQLQWRPALDSEAWVDFGPPVAGNGATNCVSDSARNSENRFYRVVKLP